MALQLFLVLACFFFFTHGRRVQTPLEHLQHAVTSDSASNSRLSETKEHPVSAFQAGTYAALLLAQQRPNTQATVAAGSSQHRLAVTNIINARTLVNDGSAIDLASEIPLSDVDGVGLNRPSSSAGLAGLVKESHSPSSSKDVLPILERVENTNGVGDSESKPSRRTSQLDVTNGIGDSASRPPLITLQLEDMNGVGDSPARPLRRTSQLESANAMGDSGSRPSRRIAQKNTPPLRMVPTTESRPEEGVLGSLPFFAVILSYISLAFASVIQAVAPKGEALDRLNRISNIASFLCAIDCTVFPFLLTVLPLVSAASSTGAATTWLHAASHACALWFVGPVGGLAVVTNWVQHKQPLVGLWGLTGIATIILANLHLPHSVLGEDVQAIGALLDEWHTPVNVMGCALLLSSQRYAHRLVHGRDCGCRDCENNEDPASAAMIASFEKYAGKAESLPRM